jgi:benzylsuccinate CoA-transferase BbsF subunit
MVGYPGDQPLGFKHAYADPTASLFGTFAILAALRYKKRTGKGQYIDLAQVESATGLIGEAIMDYVMNGRVKGNQGNTSHIMAPHGNYPCQGDDKWVSIAVKTDEEWAAFTKAIGNPPWTKETKFADRYQRLANSEELDRQVAQWTSKYTDYEAAEILQKAGVAAAPVLSTDAIFLDSHFNSRQTFAYVDHPIVGGTVVYDLPWKLTDVKRKPMRHAPILGEHNDYVFGELLGLSKENIKQLEKEEAIY